MYGSQTHARAETPFYIIDALPYHEWMGQFENKCSLAVDGETSACQVAFEGRVEREVNYEPRPRLVDGEPLKSRSPSVSDIDGSSIDPTIDREEDKAENSVSNQYG